MWISYFTLTVALSLSAIAAWYSIIGLTAIFSSAVIPIMIMGGMLEVAKITVTVWLHEYWKRCRLIMKLYLVPAVVALMFITSMGIFGFLSKAHTDQALVSGDSQAKIAIYDEKIRTSRDNIETNRRALKQMDEAVDQIMGRSTDEKGADKAVAVRRGQQKERQRLLAEIEAEQKKIAGLNEEAAPLRSENRKIEAEVGPIKYIAALIYGDNPDQSLLERAVRWMIVVLVVVFDPLAITMVLAATESLAWHREDRAARLAAVTAAQTSHTADSDLPPAAANATVEATAPEPQITDSTQLESVTEQPYLANGNKMFFRNLTPMVANTTAESDPPDQLDHEQEPDQDPENSDQVKAAIKQWKIDNPNDTLKNQRSRLARGEIDQLPWMQTVPQPDPLTVPRSDFGTAFPGDAKRGDSFVRVDHIPNLLYKFNGQKWIEVDKNLSDSYIFETAYLDYLIEALEKGQYDLDNLNESEREQIARRLQDTRPTDNNEPTNA